MKLDSFVKGHHVYKRDLKKFSWNLYKTRKSIGVVDEEL